MGAPTLCLGAAVAYLICERPLDDAAQGDAFVPHFGGPVATVAVTAARDGARVALAGAAGDDARGRWLRDRLARVTGVLLARLATSGYHPAAAAASPPEAVEQSGLACKRWGALE